MKIVVGTKNPAKINAVKFAFERYFSGEELIVIGENSPSKVSDQPSSQKETYEGAFNRASYCKENYDGDYFVGLEGGVDNFLNTDEIMLTAWVVILKKDSDVVGKSGGEMIYLPEELMNLMKKHKELGDAADEFFGGNNIKQKQGTIGVMTNGVFTRAEIFKDIVMKALIAHIRAWEK